MALSGANSNIRLGLVPPPQPELVPQDIIIEDAPTGDVPEIDDAGNILRIAHDDGSLTISLDGSPLNSPTPKKSHGWFSNLADVIDPSELARIADDLIRAIEDDLGSRKEWIEARSLGMRMLGLKSEVPSIQGSADGAPVEGMSLVRHPLLLEAVLRFQANARSELLPTDGPVKIRNDDNNANLPEDSIANALEMDLNHYLTATATEYYPDTDRMLLMLGFSGTAFKKVYFCPLRNRPVSETVDANDLIVPWSATDLMNARRVTHRINMRPSVVKRMQILGAYRDVALGDAKAPQLDSLQREELDQQGLSGQTDNAQDRDREIYECDCELDVKGYEHKRGSEPTGLEIPYRVTIDVSSHEILSIVRNYNEDTQDMPVQRRTYVKYTFVPGFGFYDIGLLNILGNTTNALTAAWREILDSGMYANFPGFLVAKAGARQNTNLYRIPPGGGQQIDTAGMPIREAVMPLPYKEAGPGFVAFIKDVADTGTRIGGTSEAQVGEGRSDAPVGTTLALIDQATKVLDSVHKRMHAAQAQEFQMLCEVFREHPESFWQRKGKSNYPWDAQTFTAALDNNELVPQADPNTASHTQRVMKVVALKELQRANPDIYDLEAVDKAALQAIGWSNPDQFLKKDPSNGKDSLEIQKQIEELKIKQQEADAKTSDAKSRATDVALKGKEIDIKQQEGAYAPKAGLGDGKQEDTPVDVLTAKAKMMDAETKRHALGLQHADMQVEDQNRDLDRQQKHQSQLIDLAKDIMLHPGDESKAVSGAKKVEKDLSKSK